MNNISIEEIEQKIEVGEEVIDRYFDSTTTRVGTRRQMTSRRRQDIETTKVEIPSPMLTELDTMAKKLSFEQIQQVENFIDTLNQENTEGESTVLSTKLSESVFAEIWDNPEDAEYDNL